MADQIIVYKKLKDRIKGETSDSVAFTAKDDVGDPISLVGATIHCQFRYGNETGAVARDNTIGSGITVTDEAGGLFELDAFKLEWAIGKYFYDVQITFASGKEKTYVKGTMDVLQDTSFSN